MKNLSGAKGIQDKLDCKNIENEVTESYGDPSGREAKTVRIILDQLAAYSTVCGRVPNKPFTAAVIAHLEKNSALPFVIAAVSTYDDRVNGMAVKWKHAPLANSWKFSKMVEKNEGWLRAEETIKDGWDYYESE